MRTLSNASGVRAFIGSMLIAATLPTPAMACGQSLNLSAPEARLLLKASIGARSRDEMSLYTGRSPEHGIAISCGLIGLRKRGMPDRFVVTSRQVRQTVTRELLVQSDPSQARAFNRAWTQGGCERGPSS